MVRPKPRRRRGAPRAAVDPQDLMRFSRMIFDYLVRIVSSETKIHTEEFNDLPHDFDSIKWYRVYDVSEAYTASGLAQVAWSPCHLDNRGKLWCFTVREPLGTTDGRVKRGTQGGANKWYNTRGRRTMNSYIRDSHISDLKVCSLVTTDPIEGRNFRMTEVTLSGNNAVVALCKIKKDMNAPPAPHPPTMVASAEPEKVANININAAASTEIYEPQEGHGLDLNIDACISDVDVTANHNKGLEIQIGPSIDANMDPVITASRTYNGSTGSMGDNISSNFKDDAYKVFVNRDIFGDIYKHDEDTAAHMASQMAQIRSTMEKYQSSALNRSQEDEGGSTNVEPKQLFYL